MTDPPRPTNHAPASQAAHPIMFWVLSTLALAVFTPCVLVPMWVENENLRAYERALAASIAQMEAQLAKDRAQAEALLSDPQVNARIIRRELNYQPADEQVVRFPADELAALRPVVPESLAGQGPSQPSPPDTAKGWVAVLKPWLPDWPWRDLFARSPNRLVLLGMAGGLLLAAFVLYSPSSKPSA